MFFSSVAVLYEVQFYIINEKQSLKVRFAIFSQQYAKSQMARQAGKTPAIAKFAENIFMDGQHTLCILNYTREQASTKQQHCNPEIVPLPQCNWSCAVSYCNLLRQLIFQFFSKLKVGYIGKKFSNFCFPSSLPTCCRSVKRISLNKNMNGVL